MNFSVNFKVENDIIESKERRNKAMSSNAKREKTSSITQLVKIVAREVCEEILQEREEEHANSCVSIQSSLKEAGKQWNSSEDICLRQEVQIAIAQIAQNHGRSIGAITARIRQKELVGYK